MSSHFRRDRLQSQNPATPNSCHSLLHEPTYAALTAPASSGNCRDPDSLGWGLNPHCSAIERNHDDLTERLTTHIPKNPAVQILTSLVQSTGSSLDSVFLFILLWGNIVSHQEAGR